MDSDNEILINLRIDVAVLKKELSATEKALILAHSNTLAWVGLAITITAILVAVIMKVIAK